MDIFYHHLFDSVVMEISNQASTSSAMYDQESELQNPEALWTLQPEKNIAWEDDSAAVDGKILSSKKLHELSAAIDFSRPTVMTKPEYSKRTKASQELSDSRTVTLYDLNQNHEAKVRFIIRPSKKLVSPCSLLLSSCYLYTLILELFPRTLLPA